jgi:hypothetical protein
MEHWWIGSRDIGTFFPLIWECYDSYLSRHVEESKVPGDSSFFWYRGCVISALNVPTALKPTIIFANLSSVRWQNLNPNRWPVRRRPRNTFTVEFVPNRVSECPKLAVFDVATSLFTFGFVVGRGCVIHTSALFGTYKPVEIFLKNFVKQIALMRKLRHRLRQRST